MTASTITIRRQEEERDLATFELSRLVVTPAGETGAFLWIDDSDGIPIANVRLTGEDARWVAKRLLEATGGEGL